MSSFAQSLSQKMAPIVSLGYEDVSLDLTERALTFKAPTLTFSQTGEVVPLTALTVAIPNVHDLIFSGYRMSQDEWPRGLLVYYEGFAPALEGAFASAGYEYLKPLHDHNLWPHQSCGRYVDEGLMRGMAYNKVNISGSALLILDDADQVLDMGLVAHAQGMFDINVQAVMEWRSAEQMGQAKMRDMQLTLQDAGFNRRYHAYCAQRKQHAEALYLNMLSDEIKGLAKAQGMNKEGYETWRALFQDNASASLKLPVEGLALSDLSAAFAARVSQPQWWQGMYMQVQHKPVRWNEVIDPGYVWRQKAPAKVVTPTPAARTVKSQATTTKSSEPAVPAPARPQFHDHPVSSMAKFVGYNARLGTYYGRNVEGKLLSVTASEVKIEQRMSKGVAVYRLPVDKVSYFEVYY
ncbi:MAG: hypothetical protein ACPGMR_11315 [Pontibacterium sp.]